MPGGAELATIPGAAHFFFSDRPEETLGILARGWRARTRRPERAGSSRWLESGLCLNDLTYMISLMTGGI